MRESSHVPLFDLRKLNASLPVPKPVQNSTRVFVLGAEDDFIVVRTAFSFLEIHEIPMLNPGIAITGLESPV